MQTDGSRTGKSRLSFSDANIFGLMTIALHLIQMFHFSFLKSVILGQDLHFKILIIWRKFDKSILFRFTDCFCFVSKSILWVENLLCNRLLIWPTSEQNILFLLYTASVSLPPNPIISPYVYPTIIWSKWFIYLCFCQPLLSIWSLSSDLLNLIQFFSCLHLLL